MKVVEPNYTKKQWFTFIILLLKLVKIYFSHFPKKFPIYIFNNFENTAKNLSVTL